jgi:tryptophan synthase alpha chain
MNGVEHISGAFHAARQAGRAAFMPYYTIGYPDLETSLAVIEAVASSGADLIELGMPFSDPLADGPTIQRSTQVALEAGVTIRACLESVRRLRQDRLQTPLLLMGYLNPLLTYGIERFVEDAAAAGADGLILPDLPPEEAQTIEDACRQRGLALVYLLSPASTPERVELVARRASGFIYLVSVLGVTGARERLSADLEGFVARVRACSDLPLAVGFGISTPEQATQVGRFADGVIVGSALIDAAGKSPEPAQACAGLVQALRTALIPA